MKIHILAAACLAIVSCATTDQPPPTSTANTETPITIGASYKLASKFMGETRNYNVWLPPSYADGKKEYPVIYLIDGGVNQDFHHITGLAQLGAIAAMFQDVIIVGVESDDRQNELTYTSLDQEHIDEFPTHGGANIFRQFLTDELMPVINNRYRTNGNNGLLGESLAGLFIVDTFLNHAENFDIFLAISPSVWWDLGSLGANAKKNVGALPKGEKKIYLTIANEGGEMRAALLQIVDALKTEKAPGVGWVFSDRPDLTHSTIYHREALEALVWAYPLPKK